MSTSSVATPQRTCVGCRSTRPQTQLTRWALTADGRAVNSRTAAGRGAWLCADTTTCLALALKRKGFERAWRRPLPATAIPSLHIAEDAMTTNMEN